VQVEKSASGTMQEPAMDNIFDQAKEKQSK
jgi:hypothetical protein